MYAIMPFRHAKAPSHEDMGVTLLNPAPTFEWYIARHGVDKLELERIHMLQ